MGKFIRSSRLAVTTMAIMLIASLTVAAPVSADEPVTLSGYVHAPNGDPLINARVDAFVAGGSTFVYATVAQADGSYSMPLTPGFYDIWVTPHNVPSPYQRAKLFNLEITTDVTQDFVLNEAAGSSDPTPPVVTAIPDRAPDHNGWYTSPVTITWEAYDPEPSSGQPDVPPVTVVENEHPGQGVSTDPVCDGIGNCVLGFFQLSTDFTAPVASIEGPLSSATYPDNQVPPISCVGTDAGGLPEEMPEPEIVQIDSTVTVTCVVEDLAGHVSEPATLVFHLADSDGETFTLSGTVTAPNGDPMHNATVEAYFQGGGPFAYAAIVQSDGSYSLPLVAAAYYLRVTPQFGPVSPSLYQRARVHNFDISQDSTLDFVLGETASSTDNVRPVVSGDPSRVPDHNDWYNAPVTVTWSYYDPAPSSGEPEPIHPSVEITNESGGNGVTSDPVCDGVGNCTIGLIVIKLTSLPQLSR